MKKIELHGQYGMGKHALVDDEDFEFINSFYWYSNAYGYAISWFKDKGINKCHFMHRIIMKTVKGKEVDHINRNRLDNQKCNLRNCGKSQQRANDPKKSTNTSGHRGISWSKSRNKWQVDIQYENKRYSLGRYVNIDDAIDAYRNKAIEIFGTFTPMEVR